MKLVIIVNNLSVVGGLERVVANLANAFATADGSKYSVIIYSFLDSFYKIPYKLDSKVKLFRRRGFINFKRPKNAILKLLFEILCVRQFIKAVNAVILRLRKWEFKRFIIKEKPDFIIDNENKTLLSGILNASKCDYIKCVHNNFEVYKKLDLSVYKNIALLVSKERQDYKNLYPQNKFFVIPNFLPEIPASSCDYSKKVVLSIGRLNVQKGFCRLIEAWNLIKMDSNFKEWKLHIVGEGELKDELEAQIAALNLQDSIILKPFTNKVENEYKNASIYAMTSLFEGLPMVLLEAASYGMPLISFDILSGPREVIDKNGFLIKDGKLESYAERLKTLMSDENLRQSLGAESKRIAQEKFSKSAILQKWQEAIKQIKECK